MGTDAGVIFIRQLASKVRLSCADPSLVKVPQVSIPSTMMHSFSSFIANLPRILLTYFDPARADPVTKETCKLLSSMIDSQGPQLTSPISR